MPRASRCRIGVSVVLYGRPVAFVRFVPSPIPILPPNTWRVTYFDYEARSFEHRRVPDDGLRCFVNLAAIVPTVTEP